MDQSLEQWRPVVGYEGLYEVSDHGQVQSVDRTSVNIAGITRNLKGKLLSIATDKDGYPVCTLCKNGKKYMYKVHRLVLLAFVGPSPEGMQCAHWDGVPANNLVSNLRWATPSDNNGDKLSHGTSSRGNGNGRAKLDEHDVRTIRGDIRSNKQLARQYSVSDVCIGLIKRRKSWAWLD